MTQRILRTVSDMALKTETGLRRCYTMLRRLGRKTSQHDHAAAELIAESGLFNGGWYLAHYPEAAKSGMQPALHYMCVGAAQGNDPGPSFSSSGYLARYPDVAVVGMNPLLHYLRFGNEEGRDIAAAGTTRPAAPKAGGPWDVPREPPLAASETVRFSLEPWLAGPDRATSLPPDSRLDGPTLSLSGVSLGFVGAEGAGKLKAVAAFARLSGVDVTEALGTAPAAAEANSGTPGRDTMLSLGSAAGFDFGDIWFINDRDLRVRLNAPPGCIQRFVLSCYQFAPAIRLPTQQPATQRRLLRLAEQVAPRGELDFADISTSNPYLPLLLTLTTADGAMIAATLLPFPSLCRGGAHYGELLSASDGKDYLTALRAVSHLLLEERLSDARPPALARIEVDLRDATGAERIFSADLRSWLDQEGGVTIAPAAPARSSEERAVRYLEESVTTPAPALPSATRPFTLRLPADAIPSLRVLVSRQLPWPDDGEPMVGAFVVAAKADGAPRWCIVPPAHADLGALQPEGGSGFPILLGSGSAMRAPAAEQRAVLHPEPLLLALRFCDLSHPQTSRLVAPVAPEAPGPLLPAVGVNYESQLSVLHHVSGSPAHLEAFLESLQRQRLPVAPEVILVLADERSDHAALADDLLPRYFPETGRIVRHPERADPAQRLQAAAATAQGQFLLFVGDDVILHDARTLVTLRTLAHYERAASASCLMIAADEPAQPKRMKVVSGGYYCHEASSGLDSKSVYLDACTDLAALPPATWPVAANDPRILMVRSDVWRKLSGFSAAGQQADLDYARAAMAGYSHYCTSAISVTLLGDVAGSFAIAAAPLSPATRAGTVLRRLVA